MKRWFKAHLGAGHFVTCAVGFLCAPSETAAGGHCHIEWCAPWLIVFFPECQALSAISSTQCVHPPFCLFCLIWEGKDLMAEVFCFQTLLWVWVVLWLFPSVSAQVTRFFPDPDSVNLWLCRLEGLYLRHEDWVMAGIMEMVATNSLSLQAVTLVLLSSSD